MPEEEIDPVNIGEAVQWIIRYLEDTRGGSHKAIYFNGWYGLGASAVLRAIAEDPPPSLRKKFDKIIHVDCSKWKSRRALQRAIAEELKLPQRVMDVFDRQDQEDDFSGVDEGSRAEIGEVTREIFRAEMGDVGRGILQALMEYRCLVVFHNGSNDAVDLVGLGIPQPELFGTKVLWTFRGRLRLNPELIQRAENSHLILDSGYYPSSVDALLLAEAREIAGYTHKPGITTEIAAQCCLYLLSLNYKGGDIMDYNWATYASSYWVCDGIIQHEDEDEAWEIGVALHKEIILDDYSSNKLPAFGGELQTPRNRWVSKITYSNSIPTVQPETSSFFLSIKSESGHLVSSLPNNMFQQSEKLRVLKLSRCTFSFSSPPFYCCQSLRFLGLDSCKDQRQEQAPKQQQEEEEKPGRLELEFFQSLWVLDICNMDWELALSPEIIEQMAANIREVHTTKGRIWRSNLSWRRLQMLRKLRITEPTSSWETGQKDEFTDMGKLELLNLSRNSTMQVLPSLSGATGLKTLVLDGCVGLEFVGPGLPPSLESFSLDAGVGEEAKISRISLAGCARLLDFSLRGQLPILEELDLSGTSIKILDIKNLVAPILQQMILLGCFQLHAILWPEEVLSRLAVLCVDSLVCHVQTEHHRTYATIMDMRFFQSLVSKSHRKFCWSTDRFHLNLCGPSNSKEDGQRCNKEKMGRYSIGRVDGQPLHKSLIPKTSCSAYTDVTIDKITIDHDDSSASQFQPLDRHLEIGEGINNTNVESLEGINAIIFVMDEVESLHVHDNSSITTVIPQRMSVGKKNITWLCLKRCRVERCLELHNVFTTNYDYNNSIFINLETIWVADLPMANCIWSKGRTDFYRDKQSFAKLRSIHLHSCPRLVFALPLSWNNQYSYLPDLETLHIVYCGDLKQVFPVEAEFLNKIATDHRKGVLKFPNLKHIYLHELPSLQQICEAKMSAPMLETVRVKACWGLRRLPAVYHHPIVDGEKDSRPTVDCEKDWWEMLDWDKLQAGHDPSLFKPCHSQYYKKALHRGSVLR